MRNKIQSKTVRVPHKFAFKRIDQKLFYNFYGILKRIIVFLATLCAHIDTSIQLVPINRGRS